MNEDVMKALYEFNKHYPQDALTGESNTVSGNSVFKGELAPVTKKRKAEDKTLWGGWCIRVMLHCLYTLSMLCLLRYDEALNIRWEDITKLVDKHGVRYIQLNLLVRKTAQYGSESILSFCTISSRELNGLSDIAPFFLYKMNSNNLHMCAVSAVALWWKVASDMGIQRNGYMFRKRVGFDRVSYDAEDRMVNICLTSYHKMHAYQYNLIKSSDSFMVCFRNNLLDVGEDPRMYGTHSFRRGGCQYLHLVKRWPIRDICSWGGWSDNFDSTGTIFKYLLSWTDRPTVDRADYFNPNRLGTDPCKGCGRTCNCA